MRKAAAVAALLGLALVSLLRAREAADFEDLESRIDYAYFTEDPNALRTVIQTAAAAMQKDAQTAPMGYVLALAQYRLGLLLIATAKETTREAAAEAMSSCVNSLAKVIDAEPKSAEGYALQSACHAELGQLRQWQLMVHASLSTLRMEKALKLAPGNPRVMLLDGVRDYSRSKALGGNKVQSPDKFRRAVASFEAQQSAEGTPNWGHADAYLYLGRSLMEVGDTLGARNAFERALIIAPEFAAARRELHRLMGNQ